MDYYKVIEFLVQDVAKKDELIAMLEAKLNSHDVKVLNDELKNMTIEKDHWKAEALEYRNEKEPEWWAEEEKYKAEIVRITQDRVKVVLGLEDTIKGLHNTVDRFKADYLAEADYVHEKEEEIGAHMRKINTLSSELEAANNRYRNLLDLVKGSDKAYQDKIEALQLELNHLKNNK